MSGGFGGAYDRLLPDFERESGVKVETKSGASQGGGPQTIAALLAKGAAADVVILSREGLADLIAAHWIAAGTDVNLATVPLGVAVRAGAPTPDVSTVEGFKHVLLKTKMVAVPGSTSGIWMQDDLFPRLGVADKIKTTTKARGSEACATIAAGEADLTVLPVSEILVAPGVAFAGVLPSEIQFVQMFSAAILAASTVAADAKQLIEFLSSPHASEAIRRSGMDPIAP